MATTKIGALKITTPSNLPKNEKDLICMLLAGRLKDLWSGRLVCFELAVDELIKDTVGFNPLDDMREALGKLNSALNDFKEQSGYDKILNDVNQALGKLGDVFSLGGLCPSPITIPRIPDVLGQLNVNLFGQANNILNALGNVANPAVCLGGGPGGIGVDWNSMPGSLAQLKAALNAFKNDPAGFASVMKGFENNIKGQVNRLNAELARLKQNLADPFGIQNKKTTVNNLQRTKKSSDDYPVVDKNGVMRKNISASMTSAEMQNVLDRTDLNSTLPVTYAIKEVLDYCGDVIGLEKVILSGDPAYASYDTYYTDLNVAEGTALPKPTYANFDYYFTNDNENIVVFNSTGQVQQELTVERGFSYTIGFDLPDKQLVLKDNDNNWAIGLEYLDFSYSPSPMRIEDYSATYFDGELTWNILPEELASKDFMYFKSVDNSYSIKVNIIGDLKENLNKSYDLANLVKKALLHLQKTTISDKNNTVTVAFDELYTGNQYKQTTTITDVYGNSIDPTVSTLTYNDSVGYSVIQDNEIDITTGQFDLNKKILRSSQKLPNETYLITKLHFIDNGSIEFTQLNFYSAMDSDGTNPVTTELACYIKFKDSIFITNDGILTDSKTLSELYSLMVVFTLDDKVVYSTKETINTGVFSIDTQSEIIRLQMNSGLGSDLGDLLVTYEFKLRESYNTVIDRTFEMTDPYLNKMSIIAKGPGQSKIEIVQERILA